MNTYYIRFPRDFANEYTIGIATSRASRQAYLAEGYERISRERALRELVWRGDNATQAYVSYTVDGEADPHLVDRFTAARRLLRK